MPSLPGKGNYFIGNDPKKWHAEVPTYAKVKYAKVYPAVDLIYYGNQQQLEYDFVVAPGVDPDVIALDFEGTSALQVDPMGSLVLRSPDGRSVALKRPSCGTRCSAISIPDSTFTRATSAGASVEGSTATSRNVPSMRKRT